jgi:hypothetical protein
LLSRSEQAITKLNQAETALQEGDLVRRPSRAVIWSCFSVGVGCFVSTVAKTWLGTPTPLDWGILFVGLILCVISLLKKFNIGKEGVEGEVSIQRTLKDAQELIRELSRPGTCCRRRCMSRRSEPVAFELRVELLAELPL